MKKLLFLAAFILIAAIWIKNADSLKADPKPFRPDTQPTTVITPPHLANDSFVVQLSAYGNPIFVSLTPLLSPDNGANPQVWINGVLTSISYGSRYKINSSNIQKTVSVMLKYHSQTQEYFNQINTIPRGMSGYNNASFQGTYSNLAPNNDQAVLIICDSVLCP